MPRLTPVVVDGLPPEQPVLVSGALLLRPWEPSDAPALQEVYADPAVQQWHAESLDETEALAYAGQWAAHWRAGTRAGWAVVRDDVLVGRVTLTRLALEEGQAEVTYWTAPRDRGRGVAPAAVEAVTAWAFGLGVQRLELQHSTRNPSSCRVAAKTGFVPEGTRRRAGLHVDGWHDMHLHARLA